MIMTKETFCKAIRAIEKYEDGINKIEEVLGCHIFDNQVTNDLISSYFDMLEEVMRDEPSRYWDSLTRSYCYQHSFGSQYGKDEYLIMVNDKKYCPTTPEELYDVIKEVYWNEN